MNDHHFKMILKVNQSSKAVRCAPCSQPDNTYIVHASQTTNYFHFLKMIHAVTSWGVWLAKLDSTELTSHYTSPCFPWQSFCWSTEPCSKPPPLHRLCPLPERPHQYQEHLVSPRRRMWWWRDRGQSASWPDSQV